MNAAPLPWLPLDLINDIGWTLIHFLWQGALLALALELVLSTCQQARSRYNLAFVILLCMAAAPVATFLVIHGHPTQPVPNPSAWLPSESGNVGDDVAQMPARMIPWMNWLVLAWLMGVAAFSLRMTGGWYVAHRLTRRNTSPLPTLLRMRCERLVGVIGIARPVRFLQSAAINVPAVVGWLRPVVLLPLSAVTGFGPCQLKAIVLHELAHIRRFDAAANLLQVAVETVLFYHPAVWWVSRRIRIERENCCDDIAVAVSGDAIGYARALTMLAEWRAMPAPVMAANGGALKQRIVRVLGLPAKSGNTSAAAIAAIALLSLAGCIAASGASSQTTAVSAPPTDIARTEIPPPEVLVPPPAAPAAPAPAAAPAIPAAPAVPAAEPAKPARPAPAAAPSPRYWTPELAESLRKAAEEARAKALADLPRILEDAARQRDEALANALKNLEATAREREEARAKDPARMREEADRMRSELARIYDKLDKNFPIALRALPAAPGGSSNRTLRIVPRSVEPSYVAALEGAGLKNLSSRQLIALKTNGVTAEYVRAALAGWPDASADDIVAMRMLGIDAAKAGDLKGLRAHL